MRGADALIVRSVTRVGPELLSGSTVRFVGSATAGTDHLDVGWLDEQRIRWASAPGCNADAAAEYTLAMMLLAARRLRFRLRERRIGIVGHGNVGSRLARLLKDFGLERLVICDPPLAAAGQPGLSTMSEVSRCDVIALHVPLTDTGRWPTRHLIDSPFLDRLRTGTVLVNSARGEVVEEGALACWLDGRRGYAALDVWPHEPRIAAELVRAATVATAHVAGYSIDGKMRGTLEVYRQFLAWLGREQPIPDLLATLPAKRLHPRATRSAEQAILSACRVVADDAALRRLAEGSPEALASGFDAFRKAYPERRDFPGWHVPDATTPAVSELLRKLGFH